MKPSFRLEKEYISLGYNVVAGVDEVGRGSIAGPLLAGAAVFDCAKKFKGLARITDSKKLTAKNREELYELIKSKALDYAFGWVSVEEIDRIGVGAANILAFQRSLQGLKSFDLALIDGRNFRGFDAEYRCVIRGEIVSYSIAAASVLAKVERDRYMSELEGHDIYGFESNAGYGSRSHWQALEKHGLSPHHRRSFVSKYLEQDNNLTLI